MRPASRQHDKPAIALQKFRNPKQHQSRPRQGGLGLGKGRREPRQNGGEDDPQNRDQRGNQECRIGQCGNQPVAQDFAALEIAREVAQYGRRDGRWLRRPRSDVQCAALRGGRRAGWRATRARRSATDSRTSPKVCATAGRTAKPCMTPRARSSGRPAPTRLESSRIIDRRSARSRRTQLVKSARDAVFAEDSTTESGVWPDEISCSTASERPWASICPRTSTPVRSIASKANRATPPPKLT